MLHMSLFTGDRVIDGFPIARVDAPETMPHRDRQWLVEQARAEAAWPAGGTAKLRRHLGVLHEIANF